MSGDRSCTIPRVLNHKERERIARGYRNHQKSAGRFAKLVRSVYQRGQDRKDRVTYQDIADAMGVSRQAVRQWIHKAGDDR